MMLTQTEFNELKEKYAESGVFYVDYSSNEHFLLNGIDFTWYPLPNG